MGERRSLRTAFVGMLVMALFLALPGCDVIEAAVYACLDADGPRFETNSLPVATQGEAYRAVVTVEIVREPYEELYDFSFSISGTLPPGLELRESYPQRRIEIVGTPTALGVYGFSLQVQVRESYPSDSGPTLCWTEDERSFQITVEVAPA